MFTGYLVVIPQLKFDCHGSVTSWHALTHFSTADTALDVLFHDITFQLWRPSTEDNRVSLDQMLFDLQAMKYELGVLFWKMAHNFST